MELTAILLKHKPRLPRETTRFQGTLNTFRLRDSTTELDFDLGIGFQRSLYKAFDFGIRPPYWTWSGPSTP